MASATETAPEIKSGDAVEVLVAGQYPVSGSVGYVLPEEKSIQVVINSPRGRWSLLLPQTWIVKRDGAWRVELP